VVVDAAEVLERRIPDAMSTAGMPDRLAAEIDFLAGRVDRWCETSDRCSPAVAARSLASTGRRSEALTALATCDPTNAPLTEVAVAAWAASRVGGSIVPTAFARLATDTSEFVDDELPVGPRRMYVGLLHAAQGDLANAIDELHAAVVVGDARAPLWGALCRLELGRVLRTAEAVPIAGVPSSAPVLTAARTFFTAGGYRALVGRVDAARASVPALIEAGPSGRVGFGVQPSTAVRGGKGLIALGYLIEHRDRVVPAAELAAVVDGREVSADVAALAATWAFGDDDRESTPVGTSETIRDVLFDDATRSRTTKLLRRTIAKLSESHRLIAEHLDASIVTGHGCRYRPVGAAVEWNVDRPH
jgi:hypothetical protein